MKTKSIFNGLILSVVRFGAIAALLLSPIANAATAVRKSVLAYYEGDGGASSAALKARFNYFNQIASDTYSVSANGTVSGTTFTKHLNFARSKKMQTFATVSNFVDGDFNSDVAHSVIRSTPFTQRFIIGMLAKLAGGRYTGINIDFEAVPATDRTAFTTFIKAVAQKMHQAGYRVVVSVPAKSKDNPKDSWTGAFDYRAIGLVVDVVQLMTYDENVPSGNPGPVAALDWVNASVRYALSVVPARKISLGLAAYGYDWDLTNSDNNTQVAYADILALYTKTKGVYHWDAASFSPYFLYTLNGHNHVVWYENIPSTRLKSRLVTIYNLGGVSIYALGMEDVSYWQAVHAGGF